MIDINTESMLFLVLIGLLITFLLTFIVLAIHAGLFTEIIISTCRPYIGEIIIAYKFARGPYKESGPLFTEAHTLLPQYRTIGVYYDDPREKEASHLRYIVGLIISENGKPLDTEDEAILKDRGFNFAKFPQIQHAVQTNFPFNSTLSIIIAIVRVYPRLNEYVEMRSLCAHPFLEVYDDKQKKIYFIGPLEKQDDFHVPEVKLKEAASNIEDEDDKSSVSWDDSASYIRSDIADVDSESIADDNSLSLGNLANNTIPLFSPDSLRCESIFQDDEPQINLRVDAVVSEIGAVGITENDSDNTTASSFEEIDEKEAFLSEDNPPEMVQLGK